MSAYTSLTQATTLGPGESRQLVKPTAHHTIAVFLTGEPASCVVTIEGSHDGYHWWTMGNVQCALVGGVRTLLPTADLALWVRANLIELGNGDSPTVTVTIASADDV
jgi:hypothetical protein